MNKKVLTILEYNRITEKLADFTTCENSHYFAVNLVPSQKPETIKGMLDATENALLFINKRGNPPGLGVKDVTEAIIRAEAGSLLNLTELLNVLGLLKAVRALKSYANSSKDDETTIVGDLIDCLDENKKLAEDIDRSILSEDEIADNATPELFKIRRQINSLRETIKERLNNLIKSSNYSKSLQDAVVTMRDGRYCVPVKASYKSEVPGVVHDASQTGQTLFVEPLFVVETNNKIRELLSDEKEEIERILRELSQQVGNAKESLLFDLKQVSKIDFAFAKARLAIYLRGTRPNFTEEKIIDLKKARHPLIDPDKVVPITVTLGTKDMKLGVRNMIITGPNTGGKTVTLKTVGLLSLMAMSGLFIPALEGSMLPIYSEIFADIGDEQSISQNLSTFSSHMKNIVGILNKCDDDTLVLFDELGAGTDPQEGAALAMAILRRAKNLGATVLATTHYSELKVFAESEPSFINASCEFNVDTLMPTYKLLIGVPGMSNAFAISKKLGLSDEIIEDASNLVSGENLKFEDLLSGIEAKRTQIDSDKLESEALLKKTEDMYKIAERNAEEEKKTLSEAKERYAEYYRKIRVEAEILLSEIRSAATMANFEGVKKAEASLKKFEENLPDEMMAVSSGAIKDSGVAPNIDDLSVGQDIHIVSMDADAVIEEIGSGGKIFVRAGLIRMPAEISDIRIIKKKKGTNKCTVNMSTASSKSRTVKTELDLRGMYVEEALLNVDSQINNSLMAGLETFTIIHGKGTGALRKGIQEYLSKNKHVKDFRSGTYGEGDFGVTIVNLR